MNKFVLIGAPRTGLSLVKAALSDHPECHVFGELFDPSSPASVKSEQEDVFSFCPYTYGEDAGLFLRDWVFNFDRYPADTRAVGLTLRYDQARDQQASYRAWEYLLGDHSVHVIHLFRENLLEGFVALMHAIKSRSWLLEPFADGRLASYGPTGTRFVEKKPTVPPFEVITEQAEYFFQSSLANRSWTSSAFGTHPYVEIAHRKLGSEFKDTLDEILDFLEIDRLPVKKKFVPPDIGVPAVQLSNYDELKDYFSRSIFSDFFKEERES